MSDKDPFGDRMKLYEKVESGRKLIPLLPIMARIDGRKFSRFTKGLERPYDKGMSSLMVATTKWLVEETNACMGYTQSDEISLTWYTDNFDTQLFFDGKVQKMTSLLSAMATVKFNKILTEHLPDEYADKMPTFDARVWNMPNLIEGSNVFLWRENDATKNSISMAARAYYSHKALMNKSGSEMQEMLFQKGVNWNNYPAFFKRGTFIQRKKVKRPFSAEEIAQLPLMHAARRDNQLMIERSQIQALEMPPFVKVKNRPEVIYFGNEPEIGRENESPTATQQG